MQEILEDKNNINPSIEKCHVCSIYGNIVKLSVYFEKAKEIGYFITTLSNV